MKSSFSRAIRRATRQTRAGRPVSATLTIQRAFGAAMLKSSVASMSRLPGMSPANAKALRKPKKAAAKPLPGKVTKPVRKAGRRKLPASGWSNLATAALMGRLLASGQTASSPTPDTPRGARFLARHHACAAGSRAYKLYLPAGKPDGPVGLVVMLHGCTQDPDDFATGTNTNAIAQKHGLAVAYPAQSRARNAASCWNWFLPANQRRGTGEPAVIASLAQALMREFGLNRTRVFVAGLSAGGAMAAILADTYPDVFSAAGLHSALARGSARSALSARAAMRDGKTPGATAPAGRRMVALTKANPMRRIVFQGDDDSTVHPLNALQIVAGAVGGRTPTRRVGQTASGRDYMRSDYALPDGSVDLELWQISGAAHAWSGGTKGGTFTDLKGPDASAEMMRFFMARA